MKGDIPALGLYKRITSHSENQHYVKCYKGPQTQIDSLEQPTDWKIDMMFRTWNVGSLFGLHSMKVIAQELLKYKFD
jgi:hypothetical protein